jgi:tryptophan-rich sensory protein
MEFTAASLVWRVLFAVVAIVAVLVSRRPTMAQRLAEAMGYVALFGVAWTLLMLDLVILVPFLAAAAIAFGLLAVAEARH